MPRDLDPSTVGREARDSLRADAFTAESPARCLLHRIGDKWTILILCSLSQGTLRFHQVRGSVAGISNRVLAKTLRGLEREGLVTRRAHATVPPKVEYSLTPLGRRLTRLLERVRSWAERNVGRVAKAQVAYDARAGR
jgi:DNA-binding HxlR family transcriptional regulator